MYYEKKEKEIESQRKREKIFYRAFNLVSVGLLIGTVVLLVIIVNALR